MSGEVSHARYEWQETEIGNVPIDWKVKEMGSLLKEKGISVGVMYPGDFTCDGIPLIRAGDIKNGKIDKTTQYRISKSTNELHKRTILNGDELLVVLVGQPGIAVVVDDYFKGWNVARAVGVLRFVDCSERKYVAYALKHTGVKTLLLASCNTTVQPTLNLAELKEVIIPWPQKEVRMSIASILSSLDDKIDLLHSQNKTLEAMAETLFRQWFIEAVPQPSPQPSPSGRGGKEEAQEDWEVASLEDVITVKGGTTPSTKEPEYWEGDIYWTSPRDLSNHESVFMFDTDRKITERGLAKIGSGLLPIGSVLLSSRAPIGYLAITEIPTAINQGYIAIICDKMVSNYFMYLWCKVNMEEIKNAGNGSVFQEISKSNFKSLPFLMPPNQAIPKFDEAVRPLFEKIKGNQKQKRNLEKLRDTLLPKLMSGEVRVDFGSHAEARSARREVQDV